jgi:sugar lactone lactonase YvrE
MIENTSISNGMAWSPDRKFYYYIDSPTYEIWRFEYGNGSSPLSDKTVVVKVPEDYGAPDGMTADAEGKLWVAHWGGNCVRQWDPETGNVMATVEVEVPQVTSCCFGGKDLRTLYITTARGGMEKEAINDFPLSGGLFHCRPGASGVPMYRFEL